MNLHNIIQTSSANLYQDRYFSRPVDYAQDQLMGRTHYVDPDTLRYFKARISSARTYLDGAFFLIIESSAKNYENTSRGFRGVLFDVFGEAIYRPEMDDMTSTSDKARRNFEDWAKTFDPIAYYAEIFARRLARQEMALLETKAAAQTLDVMSRVKATETVEAA